MSDRCTLWVQEEGEMLACLPFPLYTCFGYRYLLSRVSGHATPQNNQSWLLHQHGIRTSTTYQHATTWLLRMENEVFVWYRINSQIEVTASYTLHSANKHTLTLLVLFVFPILHRQYPGYAILSEVIVKMSSYPK